MSRDTARKVLEIEARAILDLVPRIDDSFDRTVEALFACAGRVVVTGMGKSGIIAQKISATFASTGTPSLYLHPVEAIHGDLGRIVKGDAVLAVSYSGDPRRSSRRPRREALGSPHVSLTGPPLGPRQRLGRPPRRLDPRGLPPGLAPTASTTAALAMGALAALIERRGFWWRTSRCCTPAGGSARSPARRGRDAHGRRRAPREVDTR
jgi:arabinose-5-phosphate isomerase